MAVFFNTGQGEIFGGASRDECIQAMHDDYSDIDESKVFEMPGTDKIAVTDENEQLTEDLISLDEVYTEGMGAYCVAKEL